MAVFKSMPMAMLIPISMSLTRSIYLSFLVQATAQASQPYVNVEFFYQWGPADRCHFSCCGACTNVSGVSSSHARSNANLMRKVMWDNYMAGVTGPFGFFDPLGLSKDLSEQELMLRREACQWASNPRPPLRCAPITC